MDTKKVLQLLVRIADKQQKIINKMAQANTDLVVQDRPQAAPVNTVPPPTGAQPRQMAHNDPAQVLLDALPPNIKATVNSIKVQGPDMHVQFQPGKLTQPNYDAVMRTLKNLTNPSPGQSTPIKIEHAYNLKAV
jgi:hypothetical protein